MDYYQATKLPAKMATEQTAIYPKNKILMHYSFLGGVIGGLLFTLGLFIVSADIRALFAVVYAVPLGLIIGLVPAGITGMILVRLKQHINKATDFVLVGAIGCAVTFILSSFFLFYPNGVTICLVLSGIGSLSATIIAIWALPRH